MLRGPLGFLQRQSRAHTPFCLSPPSHFFPCFLERCLTGSKKFPIMEYVKQINSVYFIFLFSFISLSLVFLFSLACLFHLAPWLGLNWGHRSCLNQGPAGSNGPQVGHIFSQARVQHVQPQQTQSASTPTRIWSLGLFQWHTRDWKKERDRQRESERESSSASRGFKKPA